MSSLSVSTLRKLVSVQAEIASADPDVGALLDLVVVRAQELTGAGGAAIELAEGDDMVYRAVSGLAEGQLGLRLGRIGSFSGLCVAENKTLTCEDSEADERVDREACRLVGLRSMVVQPLIHHKEVIGALKVMAAQSRFFGADAGEVLGLLSAAVAGALANAAKWAKHRALEEDLTHLASHDPLTGISNRSAFYDKLRQALSTSRRLGTPTGLVLFDLDGLKFVNDTYGHQAGDFFLRSFAERVCGRIRETDTLARLGGDEFGVVLALLADSDTAHRLGTDLARHAEGPLEFESVNLALRTSVGTAVAPDDGGSAEELIARADARLYAHKRQRKGL
jgi:diguanylate cyclase (GGDEF)-like protein